MTTFQILPAIDLRAGRVVRLRQGDFARETVYEMEPAEQARAFAAMGARLLHVVDLDAARTGAAFGRTAIEAILAALDDGTDDGAAVELAGGIRSDAAAAAAFEAGAARVVIGTAALANPGFAGRLVEAHGSDRVVVALDVRAGRAVGDGWDQQGAGMPLEAQIARLADEGVTLWEVTAIERDGLLGGPDLDLLESVVGMGRGSVIASGGIATLDDIRRVRSVGCSGAIVGRALYEGRIDLRTALALAALAPD